VGVEEQEEHGAFGVSTAEGMEACVLEEFLDIVEDSGLVVYDEDIGGFRHGVSPCLGPTRRGIGRGGGRGLALRQKLRELALDCRKIIGFFERMGRHEKKNVGA
jgi:hypothetical protein